MLLANRYYDDSARHATLPSPPMPIPYTQANKYPVPSRIQERRRGRVLNGEPTHAHVLFVQSWKEDGKTRPDPKPRAPPKIAQNGV
jgi:hypothetical protein